MVDAKLERTILILAAHPDDEVLGVGGTVARHAARRDKVHIVIAAEGATSRGENRNADVRRGEIDGLQAAARRAAQILGAASVRFLGFPDNRCDSVDRLDLTKAVEQVVSELRPDTVYVHHCGDVNIDHRLLHEAAFTACRPQPKHCVKRLLSFETVSSTEWAPPGSLPVFQPTVFVDVSAHWQKKLAALDAYQSEMRKWPHPRSITAIEHLGRWRGASVGVHMAEAFMLLREVADS
jgi:LmbE family N-acetylglucosaminyl deacetylase